MTPWTVALQALLSMGFSRQQYWSGLPCPPPGRRRIFLTQGSKLGLPHYRQILYRLSHQRSPSYFQLEIYLHILLFLFLVRTRHFSSLADVLLRLYHQSEGWALQTCCKLDFCLSVDSCSQPGHLVTVPTRDPQSHSSTVFLNQISLDWSQ